MLRIMGLVMAGGLVLGVASSARAQVAISIGAQGGGYYPNTYGYNSGYSGYNIGYSGYNSGYSGYNSGYSGFVAPPVTYSPVYVAPRVAYPAPIYAAPVYSYPTYRVYQPAYSYGYPYRPGFRPFRRGW